MEDYEKILKLMKFGKANKNLSGFYILMILIYVVIGE